jgi:hypothetical protein
LGSQTGRSISSIPPHLIFCRAVHNTIINFSLLMLIQSIYLIAMAFNDAFSTQHEPPGTQFEPKLAVRCAFDPNFNTHEDDDSVLSSLKRPTTNQVLRWQKHALPSTCRLTTVGSNGTLVPLLLGASKSSSITSGLLPGGGDLGCLSLALSGT